MQMLINGATDGKLYLILLKNSLESKVFSPEKDIGLRLGRRFSVDDLVEKQLTVKPTK